MKTRREMSQKNSDKAPVSFCDVAACFSEEECKLLQEWQKELYKNVMKEIHHAFAALGPLIATSVFSLIPKEKEDLYPVDHQDSEIRSSISPSPRDVAAQSDVLFRKTRKESQYPKDTQDTDQRESNDGPSTGYQLLNSDNILRMDQELGSSLMAHYATEEGESSTGPSLGNVTIAPVVSFRIKEERETYSMDHMNISGATGFPFHNIEVEARMMGYHGTAREESSVCLNLEPEVTTPVASTGINEEGETYPIGIPDYRRRESITSPAGAGSMNREKQVGEPVQCAKKTAICKASSGKKNTKVLQSYQKGTHSRSQLWSESFRNSEHFTLHHGRPKVGIPHKYNECESNLWNSPFLNGLPNTQQSQTLFICTECDKSYSHKVELIRHMDTHSGVRPYACTDCDKSFFQKPNLIKHFRTHSGEKPYACTFCHKRFSRKDNLNGHMRIHTGERPYKCTECEKSFTWKSDLNQHRRSRH